MKGDSVRRLKLVVAASIVLGQLAGCSSCQREEEEKPPETKTLPNGKAPSVARQYRFQLRADASAESD